MLKGEGGKRCQRPPKAAAAAAPDAQCQKTDLSRVQSAKAFLFSTIATATLSLARSLAPSLARSLGASHFFYTSFLGHRFPLRSCPSSLRFSSAFLFSLLVFHLLCFSRGYFFPTSDFSIFYISLEYFFSPLTFSSFALHFGISFWPSSLSIF